MPEIVQILLILIAGLTGLVLSAHYFVGGSASLAKHLGMSPGLIGLTIVAFGTSAPEIVVSADSALKGAADLGVGNALGSNIANIGLVLGVSCLISKIPVNSKLFKLEVPLFVFAAGAAFFSLQDGFLSHIEGIGLLLCALALPFLLIFNARRDATHSASHTVKDAVTDAVDQDDEIPELSLSLAWLWLTGGLLALLVSSHYLVEAATGLAVLFHVEPVVIGLTVVALGTSLPELAASITSVLKGHADMAIGNILGSNILNIFAVMSLPGIISPTAMSPEIFSRDALTMLTLTLILVAIAGSKVLIVRKKANHHARQENVVNSNNAAQSTTTQAPLTTTALGKLSGLLFLSIYGAYYWLIFSSLPA